MKAAPRTQGIAFGLIAFALSCGAMGAPQNGTPILQMDAVDVTDEGGVKLDRGILRLQGKQYVVHLYGIGLGGLPMKKIVVIAKVDGLKNLTDLADTYQVELEQTPANGGPSSESIWLRSQKGVGIHLLTGTPGMTLASGSMEAILTFENGQ